jgi:hypothetical protein
LPRVDVTLTVGYLNPTECETGAVRTRWKISAATTAIVGAA